MTDALLHNDATTGASADGDWLVDRAAGCLLAALLGDAMGTRSEGLAYAEIERRYGWIDDVEEGAYGTDDSFLIGMLARVLTATDGEASARDWGREWSRQADAILAEERRDKFFVSILQTTYKLKIGFDPLVAASGNLPSSTAAMSIAPVGIVNAGNPRAAADQAGDLASLMHPAEMAFCREAAALIAAVVAESLVTESDDVRAVIDVALDAVQGSLGTSELAASVRGALELTEKCSNYAQLRERYHVFKRDIECDSRETVPAALAVTTLAEGDPVMAITYAANFGRDTDTVGAMAGAICGALHGDAQLSRTLLARLAGGIVDEERRLATALVAVHRAKSEREIAAWSRSSAQPRRPHSTEPPAMAPGSSNHPTREE